MMEIILHVIWKMVGVVILMSKQTKVYDFPLTLAEHN